MGQSIKIENESVILTTLMTLISTILAEVIQYPCTIRKSDCPIKSKVRNDYQRDKL